MYTKEQLKSEVIAYIANNEKELIEQIYTDMYKAGHLCLYKYPRVMKMLLVECVSILSIKVSKLSVLGLSGIRIRILERIGTLTYPGFKK